MPKTDIMILKKLTGRLQVIYTMDFSKKFIPKTEFIKVEFIRNCYWKPAMGEDLQNAIHKFWHL